MEPKLTVRQEVRRAAQVKRNQFIKALDEHLSEAERNNNPLMADLYRTFLKAMRESDYVVNGMLSITLDMKAGR